MAESPDTPAADDEAALLAAVSGIVDGLQDVHARAVAAYRPEVERILRTRSRDVDHIEHTLDRLVSFCGDDEALALFKRLCRYYWDIDPVATARHVYAYREWFEAPDEDGAKPR